MSKPNSQSRPSTTHIIASTTRCDESTSCHNFMKSQSGDYLSPAPLPIEIVEGNFTPFHHFTHHDGHTTIFLLAGNTLATVTYDGNDLSAPVEIAHLPFTPHCGVNVGNTVYLMTDRGAYRVDYNEHINQWVDMGLMPQFPAVKIIATTPTQFSVITPSFTLSGNYSHWQGSLNNADQRLLTTTLLNAYSSLQNDASIAGFFIQPVMARYHLLDKNDNVLFSSSPVLVSAPSGFQCVNQLSLSSNDFTSVNSSTITAIGFQIGIETQALVDSPWAEVVANVVVETTPILDPINHKALAQCRLVATSTSLGEIKAFMPGASTTMVATTAPQENLIKNAIATFCSIASPLIKLPQPFINGIKVTAITPPSHFDVAINESPSLFTARTSAQSGDVVLWGNIAQLRPLAPSIGDIIASVNGSSGFWRAFVSVKFHNSDDIVVWNGEGESNCPSTLSPVLAYPHSDACEMTIAISCGGSIVRQSFPLTPLAGSNYAIYLHPSLAPFAIIDEAQSFIIPTQHTSLAIDWGKIAVSHASHPLLLTSSQQIGEGEIKVITPAVRSSSSWDFARTHLYLFTTAGIFATSVNAARTKISAHIIDSRSVADAHSVAFANNAVYAIASGDLLSISGAKASMLIANCGFASLAWHNATHSLLCATDSNYMVLYDPTCNSKSTCDAPPGAHLYNMSDAPLLYNNESIYAMRPRSSLINVKWSHTITINNPCQRISLASFLLSASKFEGTISIRCHSGAGDENSYPITSMSINGAINAPIAMRMIAPPRPFLTITIDGKASADFAFHAVKLIFNQ